MAVPEEYGGAGVDDWRFNAVLSEESARSGGGGAMSGAMLTTDVCLPYLMASATDEQKSRWLPGIASGDNIWAIAMSEPGTGSDLQAVKTRAVRDGDEYVINGQKTFITNGINCDHVIVVAKTDKDAGHKGCRCSSSSPTARASSAARRSRSSASTRPTRASCSSTTCASPPTTCSATRARASSS